MKLKMLFSAFTLLISSVALAQQQPDPGVIQPFSSIEAHEYDTVNLATLGIQLNVPVRSKAGHIPFSFNLKGQARVEYITNVGPPPQFLVTHFFVGAPSLEGQETQFVGGATFTAHSTACVSYDLFYNWVYYDAAGTAHPLGGSGIYDSSSCGPTSMGTYTTDGSGVYVYVAYNGPYYAIDMNGNKFVWTTAAESITDPNGNSITGAYNSTTKTTTFTDTLGEVALTSQNSYPSQPQETDTWTDALGNNRSVSVTGTPYTLLTSFGCGADQTTPSPNVPFPTSVSLPDGSTVAYGWENNYSNSAYYTGRLTSIKLPTGGTISYAYSGGTNGINCVDGTPATMTRTTPDGRWTYTHVGGGGTTTVTDPLGNNVVYTFVNVGEGGGSLSGVLTPMQTMKQVYNGSAVSAHLIQTVVTCYNNPNSTPSNCGSPGDMPITEKDEYTNYTGVTGYSAVKTLYDTYGRVTDVKTFDFNAVNPTNEKVINYGTGSPTSQTCTAISTYIIGKPCSVTLHDSQNGNAILSQTWNSYDSNGNLLQTWNLVSGSGASGTYLSKQYTYNSEGVVQTATDVNLQVMNYTTTSCSNMFVTSQYPTNFSNLTTSQSWDCNGGVVTSSTDANSQTTQDVFYVGS